MNKVIGNKKYRIERTKDDVYVLEWRRTDCVSWITQDWNIIQVGTWHDLKKKFDAIT